MREKSEAPIGTRPMVYPIPVGPKYASIMRWRASSSGKRNFAAWRSRKSSRASDPDGRRRRAGAAGGGTSQGWAASTRWMKASQTPSASAECSFEQPLTASTSSGSSMRRMCRATSGGRRKSIPPTR